MGNHILKSIIFALLLTFSLGASAHLYTYNAETVRVLDGDTMEMVIDMGLGISLRETVRVLDYNAPETWRPKTEEEKIHGEQATQRAIELLSIPYTVSVDGRGSFGRVLVDITLEDGRDFAEVMKEEGFVK